jgi:hypothetical protein
LGRGERYVQVSTPVGLLGKTVIWLVTTSVLLLQGTLKKPLSLEGQSDLHEVLAPAWV